MILLSWMVGGYPLKSADALTFVEQVREHIRTRIEASGFPLALTIAGEAIHASEALPRFYEERAYGPAWSGADGVLPQTEELKEAISQAFREGLRPKDYHLNKIEGILEEIRVNKAAYQWLDPSKLADFDLLMTDSFMMYASQVVAGRVNPETFEAEWRAERKGLDFAEIFQKALNQNQIRKTLVDLLPPQEGYKGLKKALEKYRMILEKGGWAKISEGPNMEKGMRDERVKSLRSRLIVEGDLEQGSVDNDNFDDTLKKAVQRYQRRHGLAPDGVAGPATLRQLNVPAEQRLLQVLLNMERWRWMPRNLGDRYILVNIADFELQIVEKGQKVMTMKVVGGRPDRPTPVFSGTMTYLVLNPFWYVPSVIIREDMLPQIRKDRNFLRDNHILVFRGWGEDTEEVDPERINWSAVNGKNFPYRFFQMPGPMNSLGRFKFMFPNKFNVYLHDTPSRGLFSQQIRSFSSGCVRVEKATELAEYLLRKDPSWTKENILVAIEDGLEQTVQIPEPIPVHLVYWTAWAMDDDYVQFRNDIYGRDKRLAEALRLSSPAVKQ